MKNFRCFYIAPSGKHRDNVIIHRDTHDEAVKSFNKDFPDRELKEAIPV